MDRKVNINGEWLPMVEPESGSMGTLIGREDEMKMIVAALLSNENV